MKDEKPHKSVKNEGVTVIELVYEGFITDNAARGIIRSQDRGRVAAAGSGKTEDS
jgi:hypothetical protein